MLLLEFIRTFSSDTMVVINNKYNEKIYHGTTKMFMKEIDSDLITRFEIGEAFIRHNTVYISEMR